jgi:hypothetical protein
MSDCSRSRGSLAEIQQADSPKSCCMSGRVSVLRTNAPK